MDQRASVVGRGVRLPCSDSDKSDDDVLSVGPMRPLLYAAPLGGAIGHDDYRIQDDSLHDEWSVDSWTAGDRYGTSCAQLDNFHWVMPAGYPVGVLPKPEEDDSLSQMSVMLRTYFRFVGKRRLWSRCAFLWLFQRASTCRSCMSCEYCFPGDRPPPE